MGESLRWFGAWKKASWKVGYKRRREAYASGRGGRYQIERYDEGFVVRYRANYLCDAFDDIGTAAKKEEAIALAQAHNDQAEDDVVRCPQRSRSVSMYQLKVVQFSNRDQDAIQIGDLYGKARSSVADSVKYLIEAGQRLARRRTNSAMASGCPGSKPMQTCSE